MKYIVYWTIVHFAFVWDVPHKNDYMGRPIGHYNIDTTVISHSFDNRDSAFVFYHKGRKMESMQQKAGQPRNPVAHYRIVKNVSIDSTKAQ